MTDLPPNDPRHGTVNGYRNLGCRCKPCRLANNEAVLAQKFDRATRIDPNDPRHGTESFYSNWRCRCDDCKAAQSAACARRRKARA